MLSNVHPLSDGIAVIVLSVVQVILQLRSKFSQNGLRPQRLPVNYSGRTCLAMQLHYNVIQLDLSRFLKD